jgi:hypothetical protein
MPMLLVDVVTKCALHKNEAPEQYMYLPAILKKLLPVSHAKK